MNTTTTLQSETANNTSASDTFSAQSNGLPGPANISKVATSSLLYSGSTTKTYASLMGWFGESTHMNVGYNSNGAQQVKRQVEDMMSRGIQGAVLDWFGPDESTINGTAMALRSHAPESRVLRCMCRVRKHRGRTSRFECHSCNSIHSRKLVMNAIARRASQLFDVGKATFSAARSSIFLTIRALRVTNVHRGKISH